MDNSECALPATRPLTLLQPPPSTMSSCPEPSPTDLHPPMLAMDQTAPVVTSNPAPLTARLPKRKKSLQDEDPSQKLARTASASSLSSAASEMETTPPTITTCPPIILDTPTGWVQHSLSLSQLLGTAFKAVSTSTTVRIYTKSVEDFRTAQRYLSNEKIQFHTFTLTNERPLQVVIRGLPTTVEAIEVHDDLIDKGFEVLDAKPLRNGQGTTGLWLVALGKGGQKHADAVYTVSSMFYCRVTIRKYNKSRAPIQCHRCQGFGHASFGCGRSPKCVKCGGPHARLDCNKATTDASQCANCGGSHTANYRGCPSFKALAKSAPPAAPSNRPPAGSTARPPLPRRPKSNEQSSTDPPCSPDPSPPTHESDTPLVDQLWGNEEDDEEDPRPTFAQVTRRRHRQPRNPQNRRQQPLSREHNSPTVGPTKPPHTTREAPRPAASTSHPTPPSGQSSAPRVKQNFWPPTPQAPPQTPLQTPAPNSAPQLDIAGVLAQVLQQLSAVTALLQSLTSLISQQHG